MGIKNGLQKKKIYSMKENNTFKKYNIYKKKIIGKSASFFYIEMEHSLLREIVKCFARFGLFEVLLLN